MYTTAEKEALLVLTRIPCLKFNFYKKVIEIIYITSALSYIKQPVTHLLFEPDTIWIQIQSVRYGYEREMKGFYIAVSSASIWTDVLHGRRGPVNLLPLFCKLKITFQRRFSFYSANVNWTPLLWDHPRARSEAEP
jgi:hypothetical protein